MLPVVRLVFTCLWCLREHQVLEQLGDADAGERLHQAHVRTAYCDGCAVLALMVENRIRAGLPIAYNLLARYNSLTVRAPRVLTIYGERQVWRA